MTRYCLTRAEPKSLEEAFALALREDYAVSSSYSHTLPSQCRCSCRSAKKMTRLSAGHPTGWNRGPGPPRPPSGDLPGKMIAKLADGKPHRMSRREVVLPYMFDGFQNVDTFTVIETNHAFDCILGMPWLARDQPKINWLARSVKRRGDFDVSEVFTHLLVSPSDWPHVTVVDQLSTTQSMHRASDGPLCVACSAVVHNVHGRRSPRRRGGNNLAVEQGLPHANEMTVEQVLPYANEMTVEQGLPHVMKVTVEHGLPSASKTSVEQGLPHVAVERDLAYDDSTGAVDHDLLHLEEGEIEISSSDSASDNSAPSSTSTRKRSPKRRRRRLKPRRTPSPSELLVAQTVNALEYVEGGPRRQRTLEVATPPKDAKSII
ncbi:LOW QUALITY PROTEIN: polyprotein [Phytophthora megakarya]|uniref:Polyprotein n=1 Tax=Phytophthora megakarya TaxID=4795 RepID=A0A225UMR8_9STRA|nr:LOW QUALITY PROTEIN: polyprotein [Phytophthora megakarya]